ncbi:MAG TPA: cysteine hydrolase family protein [Longimicrobium sp.]|jgi:nicotinamidase-related amidase
MTDRIGRVGWVVDAQNDFLLPPEQSGRLYVHNLFDNGQDAGATQIISALQAAVEWMRANCDVVVYTGDWHSYDDEEIDPESPDATKGTYPPHCMGLSPDAAEREGAELHAAIRPHDALVLERGVSEDEARAIAAQAVGERRPVFIHKNRFDVFTGNPATDAFLRELSARLGAPLEIYVAGVARDVCVKNAVEGMLAPVRGYPVTLVIDATWGLGLEDEAESLARWTRQGAALVTTRGLELRASRAA